MLHLKIKARKKKILFYEQILFKKIINLIFTPPHYKLPTVRKKNVLV